MITIRLRRDYSSTWAAANPVLAEAEPGYEIDTGKLKIGDGSARWSDLEYFTPGGETSQDVSQALTDHINSQTPHPAYDNPPIDLTILFENGLL